MRVVLLVAAICGLSLVPLAPASAAARNYDCSKPGNANKTVCKAAATAAAKAAAKPAPAKASKTKVSSTTTTKTVTQRNYDCSKAGNKNKAVCKSAATAATPVVKQRTVATTTRHYDCTKAGNANKAQCKVSAATHQTASKPVALPRSAAAPSSRSTARTTTAANDNNPAGATAVCKDGTYTHSKEHRGACSHHGGVAKWM